MTECMYNLEVDEEAVEFLLAGAAVKVLTTRLKQDTNKTDTEQVLWRIKQRWIHICIQAVYNKIILWPLVQDNYHQSIDQSISMNALMLKASGDNASAIHSKRVIACQMTIMCMPVLDERCWCASGYPFTTNHCLPCLSTAF